MAGPERRLLDENMCRCRLERRIGQVTSACIALGLAMAVAVPETSAVPVGYTEGGGEGDTGEGR